MPYELVTAFVDWNDPKGDDNNADLEYQPEELPGRNLAPG